MTAPSLLDVRLQEVEWEQTRRASLQHPAALLEHVRCVDTKAGEEFQFQLLDETADWYWQRAVLDGWLSTPRHCILKARQLGVTWLAAGLGLWTLLYTPGTRVLVVSINETEAAKVVNRLWDMLQSLPRYLWNGAEIIKPTRARPYTEIQLKFRDGKISTVIALASTKTAGHGETAALVILDEFARQEYARETWNAVVPTMADGGRLIVISTANGISTSSDEGNFFHHLWKNHREMQIQRDFLSWKKHPGRDDNWYRREASALPVKQRAEQYPDDPDEAFILSGDQYFDPESLFWYARNNVSKPLFTLDWVEDEPGKAVAHKHPGGFLTVFQAPRRDVGYVLAADVATGRGKDYSCAYVVSLDEMRVCAEYHGRVDSDQFATQLHYTGRWYQNARLAVEMGGGYGEAIIIPLRDGREGRPPYPVLYQHTQETRSDRPRSKQWGYPITMRTRPMLISQLEQAIRDRDFPDMPRELVSECQTFVHQQTLPSPRAQDGCNDDRVMACALALEMYRRYGTHPHRYQPEHHPTARPQYPWNLDPDTVLKRYPPERTTA